ncbi:heavy-metal-associated domain-containing protein, partial [Salmonella enterica subsp. enterica serovar Typhimurium]|nr:heavy-metal-associated domain-containing protein [Salmonella enterica subsp. enterica serovar Typhimurium]
EDSNNKNKDENKKSSEKKPDADSKKPDADKKKPDADNKKAKEAPVTSAVIKVAFHCLGCIGKIQKIVTKTKGVQEMTLDKQKETVTVKGTMNVKALTEAL